MLVSRESIPESAWFKSSYSGGNATECVECVYADVTLVRDSKRSTAEVIAVSRGAWAAFIMTVKTAVTPPR